MATDEIKTEDLNPEEFIAVKVAEMQAAVGDGTMINALSGGVDSSVCTMIGHKALGDRQLTYFIDNGLMREGEPDAVVRAFADLGVTVIKLEYKSVPHYERGPFDDQ